MRPSGEGPGRQPARETEAPGGLPHARRTRTGPGGFRPPDGVRHARRRGACGQRRQLLDRAGRAARRGRRERLGQVGHHDVADGAAAEPAGGDHRRLDPVRGPRGPRDVRPRDAPAARRRDRLRLPGPDDQPQPGVHRRLPAGRADPRPPRAVQGGGARPGGGAARAGRHPRPAAAARRLSAPVLGRHAPAGDDRHGALLRPEAADRRRADHGARRDDPGADPRDRARAAPEARHGDHLDHPRPRAGRRHRRPGDGDVCRARGRARTGGGDLHATRSIPTPGRCSGPCRAWRVRVRGGCAPSRDSRRC